MRRPTFKPRDSASACGVLFTAALAMTFIGGCAEETTVISERGLLLGLPDAEGSGTFTRGGGAIGGISGRETVSEESLIREAPTGERMLVSQSPRHVIILMRRLMTANTESDWVLLYNQLLSDDAKRQAIFEGNEPTAVLEYFKDYRIEILQLLAAMPMGELSTDVAHENVDDGSGKKRERLRIRSSLARTLEFTELWVQRENNQYRLLWVK